MNYFLLFYYKYIYLIKYIIYNISYLCIVILFNYKIHESNINNYKIIFLSYCYIAWIKMFKKNELNLLKNHMILLKLFVNFKKYEFLL